MKETKNVIKKMKKAGMKNATVIVPKIDFNKLLVENNLPAKTKGENGKMVPTEEIKIKDCTVRFKRAPVKKAPKKK